MIFKPELSPQNFHYDVLYPLYSAYYQYSKKTQLNVNNRAPSETFQPILNRFCPLIQHFQFLPRMSHISGAFIWHQMKKWNPFNKGSEKRWQNWIKHAQLNSGSIRFNLRRFFFLAFNFFIQPTKKIQISALASKQEGWSNKKTLLCYV